MDSVIAWFTVEHLLALFGIFGGLLVAAEKVAALTANKTDDAVVARIASVEKMIEQALTGKTPPSA